MRDFREIKVWAKAHRLTLEVYRVTATFPGEEIYGQSTKEIGSLDPSQYCRRLWKRREHRVGAISPDRNGICKRGRVSYPLSLGSESPDKKICDDLDGRIVEVKRMLASLLLKVRRDR
jgi:23S rRNA-intervening sequence protein